MNMGSIVQYENFKVIVIDIFTDVETNIDYATIKPIEFEGVERDVPIIKLY